MAAGTWHQPQQPHQPPRAWLDMARVADACTIHIPQARAEGGFLVRMQSPAYVSRRHPWLLLGCPLALHAATRRPRQQPAAIDFACFPNGTGTGTALLFLAGSRSHNKIRTTGPPWAETGLRPRPSFQMLQDVSGNASRLPLLVRAWERERGQERLRPRASPLLGRAPPSIPRGRETPSRDRTPRQSFASSCCGGPLGAGSSGHRSRIQLTRSSAN